MTSFLLAALMSVIPPNEIQIVKEPVYEIVRGTITAYSADPNQTDERFWEMASGKRVYEGAIACPRSVPLRTRVEINGVQFTCEDRLNKRYTDRWDVFLDSGAEARQYGIWRNQVVKIIK